MKKIKQNNLKLLSQNYPYLSDTLDLFYNFEQTSGIQFSFINERNQEKSSNYFFEKYADVFDSNLIIFVGLGDGYFISELLKKSNLRSIIVIEPDYKLFNTAICERDLSNIFCDSRVSLFVGNNYNEDIFHNIILGNISYLMDFSIITHPLYNIICKKLVIDAYAGIKNAIRYITRAVGNSPADSFIGFVNTLNNLRYFVNTVDANYLKSYTKNRPIVIVSAGPSLEKNIDVLYEIKDNVYIIAATTIYKRLISKGIKPDAISVLERDEEVYDLLFKDQNYPEDLILFSQSLVHHKIYENYKGPIVTFFRQESFLDSSFSNILGNINCFQPGNSVAHMNFQIAHLLEGFPIILLGQDLAYAENGKTHASQTIYDNEDVAHYFDANSQIKNDEKILKVEGFNNGVAISNDLWNYFKYWFETQISSRKLTVFNCTEGGARIHGAIEMKLADMIEKYSIKDYVKEEWIIPSLDNEQITHRVDIISEYLTHELNLISQIINEINNLELLFYEIQESYENDDFEQVSVMFKSIYDIKRIIDFSSPFYNFILQTFRIVNEQKEFLIGNITTVEKYHSWIELQKGYIETNKNISKKIEEVLVYVTSQIKSRGGQYIGQSH